MSGWKSGKPKQANSVTFKPGKAFIKNEVDKFLSNGGRITKLVSKNSYYSSGSCNSTASDSDTLLVGNQDARQPLID